jgi:uncharacterized protein
MANLRSHAGRGRCCEGLGRGTSNAMVLAEIPIVDMIWLVAAIVVGGACTGFLAGLFGIGGGGVIVPVLFEVFRVLGVPEGVRMQLCVGTSLAIIVPTTIRSYLAHRSANLVLTEVVRSWALPAAGGVALGALLAAYAPAGVFKFAFALIASVIATKLLFGREYWKLGSDLPQRLAMNGYGFAIGLASSLMGVSGGSLSAMVLTLYGKSIYHAVATSAALGVPIAMMGTVGYVLAGLRHEALLPAFSLGFVSLPGFAIMAPVASFFAPYGARLAHVLAKRQLEIAFGLFLLAVSLRFVVSMIAPGAGGR